MRIGAVQTAQGTRYGVVERSEILLLDPQVDLYEWLGAGRSLDALSGDSVGLGESETSPVPIPVATIRDFITFEQHTAGSLRAVSGATEVPEAWYEAPAFYFTNPHAAVGTGAEIPLPPGSQMFDFELEVAAVIGRSGFNLSVEEAEECIVGYTILNDWSARDLQRREMRVGLGPAKGKDTATTLGPVMVTADELASYREGDRLALDMQVKVNGTLIGKDNLRQMAWSFAELVAYASRGTWVRPGDIIGSGTCGGGCLVEFWGWNGVETPGPVRIGDTVTMQVEGLGEISNTVVGSPALHPVPPARRNPYSLPG